MSGWHLIPQSVTEFAIGVVAILCGTVAITALKNREPLPAIIIGAVAIGLAVAAIAPSNFFGN